ncbi:MAG: serine hydrolase domain-containing protein [Promethearchaeota archaeon]
MKGSAHLDKKKLLCIYGFMLFIILGFAMTLNILSDMSDEMGELKVRAEKQRNTSIYSNDYLDEELARYMKVAGVPSIAAAIIQNYSLVWAKGYGEQPDVDTAYMISSITKTFTSTAILQLYEQALLGLDDDVNLYLPFELRNPHYPDTPITIRMLLAHTSSLNGTQDPFWYVWGQEYFRMKNIINETYPSYPVWLTEHILANGSLYSPYLWGDWAPGEKVVYSNPGFVILGYVVELLSNKALGQYFSDYICSPLGMERTSFTYRNFNQSTVAIPYEKEEEEIVSMPYFDDEPVGCGSLYSSVLDLSRYLLAHMNGGEYNGTRILKSESVALMHEPEDKNATPYGLGWVCLDFPQAPFDVHGHGGVGAGYKADMWVMQPKDGSPPQGVILFRNRLVLNDPHDSEWQYYSKLLDLLFEVARTGILTMPSSTTNTLPAPGFTIVSFIGTVAIVILLRNKQKKGQNTKVKNR